MPPWSLLPLSCDCQVQVRGDVPEGINAGRCQMAERRERQRRGKEEEPERAGVKREGQAPRISGCLRKACLQAGLDQLSNQLLLRVLYRLELHLR